MCYFKIDIQFEEIVAFLNRYPEQIPSIHHVCSTTKALLEGSNWPTNSMSHLIHENERQKKELVKLQDRIVLADMTIVKLQDENSEMFDELYAPKEQRQDDDEGNQRKDSEGKDTIELSDSGREDEQDEEEEEEDGEEGEVTEEENEGKSSEFSSGDKTDDQEYDPEVDSSNSESPTSVAKSPQNRTRKSTSSNY